MIAALTHALDPAPFMRLWRLGSAISTSPSARPPRCLLLGVLNGMLVAIALSLVALVQRLATPHVARLGRLGDSHDYRRPRTP